MYKYHLFILQFEAYINKKPSQAFPLFATLTPLLELKPIWNATVVSV